MHSIMSLKEYVGLYGPTGSCDIRLGDTNFMIKIGKENSYYGEELTYGYNGNVSDVLVNAKLDAPDTVILNVICICPITGIFKSDIAFKDGVIFAIGKAGNSRIQKGINIEINSGTRCINGAGKILTPGAVDINFNPITDTVFDNYVSGVTTQILNSSFFGSNLGELDYQGTRKDILAVLSIANGKSQNIAITAPYQDGAKGEEAFSSGAAGISLFPPQNNVSYDLEKSYEMSLKYNIPLSIMIPPYEEEHSFNDLIDIIIKMKTGVNLVDPGGVISGPLNNLEILNIKNVNGISLDISRFGKMSDATVAGIILQNLAFFGNKISAEKMKEFINCKAYAAEDYLIALGCIPIVSSWGMQLTGGNSFKTYWDMCSFLRPMMEASSNDEQIVKDIIAKYTLNPAVAYGLSDFIGSISLRKRADVVLWNPRNFPSNPDMVFIGGEIAFSNADFSGQPEYYSLRKNFCGEGLRFTTRWLNNATNEKFPTTNFVHVNHGEDVKSIVPHKNMAVYVAPENGVVTVDQKTLDFYTPPYNLTNNNPPGEVVIPQENIFINEHMIQTKISIANTTDYPLYIGSHFDMRKIKNRIAIFEGNISDNQYARLDIPAGSRITIEPGSVITVNILTNKI